jgi:protein TonB
LFLESASESVREVEVETSESVTPEPDFEVPEPQSEPIEVFEPTPEPEPVREIREQEIVQEVVSVPEPAAPVQVEAPPPVANTKSNSWRDVVKPPAKKPTPLSSVTTPAAQTTPQEPATDSSSKEGKGKSPKPKTFNSM